MCCYNEEYSHEVCWRLTTFDFENFARQLIEHRTCVTHEPGIKPRQEVGQWPSGWGIRENNSAKAEKVRRQAALRSQSHTIALRGRVPKNVKKSLKSADAKGLVPKY